MREFRLALVLNFLATSLILAQENPPIDKKFWLYHHLVDKQEFDYIKNFFVPPAQEDADLFIPEKSLFQENLEGIKASDTAPRREIKLQAVHSKKGLVFLESDCLSQSQLLSLAFFASRVYSEFQAVLGMTQEEFLRKVINRQNKGDSKPVFCILVEDLFASVPTSRRGFFTTEGGAEFEFLVKPSFHLCNCPNRPHNGKPRSYHGSRSLENLFYDFQDSFAWWIVDAVRLYMESTYTEDRNGKSLYTKRKVVIGQKDWDVADLPFSWKRTTLCMNPFGQILGGISGFGPAPWDINATGKPPSYPALAPSRYPEITIWVYRAINSLNATDHLKLSKIIEGNLESNEVPGIESYDQLMYAKIWAFWDWMILRNREKMPKFFKLLREKGYQPTDDTKRKAVIDSLEAAFDGKKIDDIEEDFLAHAKERYFDQKKAEEYEKKGLLMWNKPPFVLPFPQDKKDK